ncbi:MAG: NUDIX domain-containing protein [Candidatus Celaenobacter antarcticus]|nr:NUDIX domain-containing protein [Candidatus Celaenobacter antarcticus]
MKNEDLKKIQSQFNKRARNYKEYTLWIENDEIYKKCTEPLNSFVKSIECLDLGGGTGWLAAKEKNKSGRNWTVLDISDEMGAKVPKAIKFVKGDFHETPFEDNKFGFIIALSTFQYSNNLNSALKELKRILLPEGQVVIAQKFDDNYGSNKKIFKTLTTLRNPLKKQIGSSLKFKDSLKKNGLKILKQYNIKHNYKYPLDKWLSRSGTIPIQRQKEILSYLKVIPEEIKEKLNIQINDGQISYDICWGIFVCAKNIYKYPSIAIVATLIVERTINQEKYILLQKRQSLYEEPEYHDQWELPQGKLERNENIRDTAVRELFEETGLTLKYFREGEKSNNISSIKIFGVTPYFITHLEGKHNFLSIAFIVDAEGELEPQILNTKPEWISISKLKAILKSEKVFPLNSEVLQKYVDEHEER